MQSRYKSRHMIGSRGTATDIAHNKLTVS